MSISRHQDVEKSALFETLIDAFIENSESSVTIVQAIISPKISLNFFFEVELSNGELYKAGLIHVAISNANVRLLKLLLENEANPNLVDSRLLLPLHQAIIENTSAQIEMTKLLLESKADADNKIVFGNKNPQHPLLYAIEHSNWEIANLLIPYCHEKNALSKSLLLILRKSTNMVPLETIQALINYGANFNVRDEFDYRRPLHLATLNKQKDIVQLLLSKNANVNLRDTQGKSPILIAANTKNWDLLHLLLTSNQQINKQDLNYLLPYVINLNTIESLNFVSLLLKLGAKINNRTWKRKIIIPWHVAATTGNKNILVKLYKHGANPNIQDYEFKTVTEKLSNQLPIYAEIYNSVLEQATIYYQEKEKFYLMVEWFNQSGSLVEQLPLDIYCLILLEFMKEAIDFYQEDLERLRHENPGKNLQLTDVAFFHHSRYRQQLMFARETQTKSLLKKAKEQQNVFINIHNALNILNTSDENSITELLSLSPIEFLNRIDKIKKNSNPLNSKQSKLEKAIELTNQHYKNCNSFNLELIKSIYNFIKPKKTLFNKLDFFHKKEKKELLIKAIKNCLVANATLLISHTPQKK